MRTRLVNTVFFEGINDLHKATYEDIHQRLMRLEAETPFKEWQHLREIHLGHREWFGLQAVTSAMFPFAPANQDRSQIFWASFVFKQGHDLQSEQHKLLFIV